MTTEVATTHQIEFNTEQIDLIKTTIARGATDDELKLFVGQCKRTGLDPFARQIHAVKRWDSSLRRDVLSIQTGIDGFRLIAERTGKYAGNDDPVYDVENEPHPNKATVTVWKIIEGQRVPFTRSARWAEFVQTKKDGDVTRFWAKMPYLMLGKVAEALALRAAFPQELSGLYTTDEMSQADNDEPVKQSPKALPATNGATAETPEQWSKQLTDRIRDKEGSLIAAGKCCPKQLQETIEQAWADAGLPDHPSKWNRQQQAVGTGLCKSIIAEFEAKTAPAENLDADPVEDTAAAFV